jgi:hypothetical protein
MFRPVVAAIRWIVSSTTQLYEVLFKCIEWQRPDDGHYRPKHVVFLTYNTTYDKTLVVLLTSNPLNSTYNYVHNKLWKLDRKLKHN